MANGMSSRFEKNYYQVPPKEAEKRQSTMYEDKPYFKAEPPSSEGKQSTMYPKKPYFTISRTTKTKKDTKETTSPPSFEEKPKAPVNAPISSQETKRIPYIIPPKIPTPPPPKIEGTTPTFEKNIRSGSEREREAIKQRVWKKPEDDIVTKKGVFLPTEEEPRYVTEAPKGAITRGKISESPIGAFVGGYTLADSSRIQSEQDFLRTFGYTAGAVLSVADISGKGPVSKASLELGKVTTKVTQTGKVGGIVRATELKTGMGEKLSRKSSKQAFKILYGGGVVNDLASSKNEKEISKKGLSAIRTYQAFKSFGEGLSQPPKPEKIKTIEAKYEDPFYKSEYKIKSYNIGKDTLVYDIKPKEITGVRTYGDSFVETQKLLPDEYGSAQLKTKLFSSKGKLIVQKDEIINIIIPEPKVKEISKLTQNIDQTIAKTSPVNVQRTKFKGDELKAITSRDDVLSTINVVQFEKSKVDVSKGIDVKKTTIDIQSGKEDVEKISDITLFQRTQPKFKLGDSDNVEASLKLINKEIEISQKKLSVTPDSAMSSQRITTRFTPFERQTYEKKFLRIEEETKLPEKEIKISKPNLPVFSTDPVSSLIFQTPKVEIKTNIPKETIIPEPKLKASKNILKEEIDPFASTRKKISPEVSFYISSRQRQKQINITSPQVNQAQKQINKTIKEISKPKIDDKITDIIKPVPPKEKNLQVEDIYYRRIQKPKKDLFDDFGISGKPKKEKKPPSPPPDIRFRKREDKKKKKKTKFDINYNPLKSTYTPSLRPLIQGIRGKKTKPTKKLNPLVERYL